MTTQTRTLNEEMARLETLMNKLMKIVTNVDTSMFVRACASDSIETLGHWMTDVSDGAVDRAPVVAVTEDGDLIFAQDGDTE